MGEPTLLRITKQDETAALAAPQTDQDLLTHISMIEQLPKN